MISSIFISIKRRMISQLFKKDKLISFVLWAFFSLALAQFVSVFFFSFDSTSSRTVSILCLYCVFSFAYYFITKKRFRLNLNYPQYIIYNLLFSVLIALFSYVYFRLVMLNNDNFHYRLYLTLLVTNFLLGSLLYLFTLIKKREI